MEFSAESPADHLVQYPESLYEYILHFVGRRTLAWDVATGHGKVAYRLAQDFEEVIATDTKSRIIQGARSHPNVTFEATTAYTLDEKNQSVDIVTVGQALHHFALPEFYNEVKRVLVPGGVIAAWGFGIPRLSMEFDRLLNRLYKETFAAYWLPGWVHQQQQYQNIPFPFKNVKEERIMADFYWSFEDWLSFLESWSAARRYQKEHGQSPIDVLLPLFKQMWGDQETRKVSFSFFVKLGLVI